jgi:hypothetical protein
MDRTVSIDMEFFRPPDTSLVFIKNRRQLKKFSTHSGKNDSTYDSGSKCYCTLGYRMCKDVGKRSSKRVFAEVVVHLAKLLKCDVGKVIGTALHKS